MMLYYSGDSSTITAMGNTFSCLNVHCVFSTKERVPILNPEVRERLWPYLGGIAKQNGIHRTRTFQEEYLAFLKAHEVKFDEKYLWD